jgi:hypothetical protein
MPPSPSAGDHEMRDYYADQNAPRPAPNQAPYLTPYLGLRARLSQVWINRWTVLLLLVLVRTLFAIASLDNNLASARREALSACTSVENVGSAMASMPHYMAQGVNHMTADGINKAVNGLMDMVTLSVTGVEEIVVFVIGMMTNTYLCLITLAVSGSLHYAIGLVTNANQQINAALKSIGNDLSTASSTLESELNSLVKGINTFTGSSIPTIDFSSEINAMNNVSVPPSLYADLQKLNNSIPTFAEVKNDTNNIIRLPFEDLKTLINKSIGNYSFNESLFPVPDKQSLTFCSDNNDINNFFDKLVKIEHVARIVFIVVLTIAAVLCCIPMAWWELIRWKRLQQRAKMINAEATDPMDAVYLASRPYTSLIGRKVANRFSTPRRQILARWAVAYPTSLPALFILALALAGLFSCLCQYILLKAIEKEVPVLTGEVANFTDKVVAQLNNASAAWANGVNAVIMDTSNDINKDLLGWVNTSTTAVNNTLNAFVDDTMNVLNQTFGGTPLYDPITGVFNCLIELKIQGIQSALTWVHDNAYVTIPTIPNDTFTLGAIAKMTDNGGASNLLSNPSSTTSDDISAAVKDVTDIIAATIKQEAIISTIILFMWLFLVAVGLIRTCILFGRHDKLRGEAGNQYVNVAPQTVAAVREASPIRPISAAPPYPGSARDPDVNQNAPYALNPHPFPLRNEDNEGEKRASSGAWPFTQNLTGNTHKSQQNPFEDEKSGYI